jgi:hypothetical protein
VNAANRPKSTVLIAMMAIYVQKKPPVPTGSVVVVST